MIKILIIEDELPNRKHLSRLLLNLEQPIKIVGATTNIKDSIHFLSSHPDLDLILADIRLEDGLSFDIFKQITTSVPIIFTTAYDEYAIQAFKYNSLDYLLKPIDEEELSQAIEKIKSKQIIFQSDTKELYHYIQQHQYQYRGRFLLPYRDGFKSVKVNDIAYISVENKTSILYLNDGTSTQVAFSMEELEEQLNPKDFFRANRQTIVHINSIERITNYFQGKLKIKLLQYPEANILLSRNKAKLLKVWLDQ